MASGATWWRLRANLASGPVVLALAGCVSFGDANSVRAASDLAVSCRTDEALSLSARTADGTTVAGGVAELQRVVFLRDAGRFAEADRALEARNIRVAADARARAETERAVEKALADLRAERLELTGRAICP